MSWCGNYGSVTPASLSNFLNLVSGSLTRLDLDNCHIATGAVMTSVGATCLSLTHISLANCHLLKPPDFQALTQIETLVSLNLYRTSIAHSCVISLLCNNRGLENFCLAACNNINGDAVKWNFPKIVVDKEGQPKARFTPTDDPIPKVEE